MFKKYLLMGCALGVLTACGGEDLDYGPRNVSAPTPEPSCEEIDYQWSFSSESELESWSVEWSKTDERDAELYWQDQRFALGIKPWWGDDPVASGEGDWDQVTAIGTMEEPVDLRAGEVYISIYYPRGHIGNPWGTDPWGQSAHHLGTQYILVDSEGRRAMMDTGNGGNWINSFDVRNGNLQCGARPTELGVLTQGIWNDIILDVGIEVSPMTDDDAEFDLSSVVGFGVRFNFALETPANLSHDEYAAYEDTGNIPQTYLFLDSIALLPYSGGGPIPTPEPPPPVAPPEFGLAIYTDEVQDGFSQWNGWGGAYDFESNAYSLTGYYSIELAYDGGYGSLQFGASDQDISAYTTLDMSVYVPEGTGNADLMIQLCGTDGVGCGDNDGVPITAVEGQWNDFALNVADFIVIDVLKEVRIKNYTADSKTIYVDDVGFDKVASELNFVTPVYLDALATGFAQWNGWGGEYDFASTAQVQSGATSIELVYDGGYGSMQIGAGDQDIYENGALHFSIYVPEGTGDAGLLIQLCGTDGVGCGDNDGVQVTATDAQWTSFSIPVVSFPTIDVLKEVRIKNYTADSKTLYADNIGFDVIQAPEFDRPVFSDALADGFSQWNGWGGEYDFESAVEVKDGTTSIELAYDGGYGSMQIGASDQNIVAENTTLHFSVFVPEGTGDANLLIQLCGTDGLGCGDNDGVQVTATDATWTTFSLNVSDFIAIDVLKELRIKNYTENSKTLYVDNIGFDQYVPAFALPVYFDATETGFAIWNGWGGEYTFDSVENVHHGFKAIELAYDGGYGSMQIGASDQDLSGYTTFHFSIYVPEDVADTQIMAQLCGTDGLGCGDNDGVQVTAVSGQWNTYSINMADFITIDVLKEVRIKNYTDAGKTLYLDTLGFK